MTLRSWIEANITTDAAGWSRRTAGADAGTLDSTIESINIDDNGSTVIYLDSDEVVEITGQGNDTAFESQEAFTAHREAQV